MRTKTPLETTKISKRVVLLIRGYEFDINKIDFIKIQLKDGTIIHPEIEIIDENGKSCKMMGGSGAGEFISFYPDDEINETDSLPANAIYKTIRIRSDKPFICDKIFWQNNNPK